MRRSPREPTPASRGSRATSSRRGSTGNELPPRGLSAASQAGDPETAGVGAGILRERLHPPAVGRRAGSARLARPGERRADLAGRAATGDRRRARGRAVRRDAHRPRQRRAGGAVVDPGRPEAVAGPVMPKTVPSSIDRLPADIREQIGALRREGATIDEIKAKLEELRVDVSRSAIGRHVKSLAQISARMRESRAVAEALVSQFGEEADNRLARVNIELMHSVVMQTITAAEVDEETGEMRAVTFDPEQAMFLARAMQSLASAEKTNSDRIVKARELATVEAAKKAVGAAKAKGISADTVDFIRKAVLGSDA